MSFQARIFRILIASPGDVALERDAVVKAIHEWNSLYALQRGASMLPVRWETHSTPEMGDRPQGIINKRIADGCDAVIGIFWTRIGSPTGVAESGTVEEVNRAIQTGRPVMLYFSSVPRRPDDIDTEQLESLRKFRSSIKDDGLIQSYASIDEFKEMLPRHLDNQLTRLIAAEGDVGDKSIELPITDIHVSFDRDAMNISNLSHDGSGGDIQSKFYEISNPDDIPDYPNVVAADVERKSGFSNFSARNVHYYREGAAFLHDSEAFRPLVLTLQNVGTVGARDVWIEIDIESETEFAMASENELQLEYPRPRTGWARKARKRLRGDDKKWHVETDVGAAQPQRLIHIDPKLFIAAWTNCTIRLTVKIYADILSHPLVREMVLNWRVEKATITAEELVIGFKGEDSEGDRDGDSQGRYA